jgi:hypothetical protein
MTPAPPRYIAIADLPAALAARGITITPRQARAIASERKLPFFKSPIGRELVTTEALIDEALSTPAAAAAKEWRSAGAGAVKRRRGK